MLTITYLRRPLHLRVLWRLEAIYLRWRIRCAESDKRGHEIDLIRTTEDVTRLQRQMATDVVYIHELTLRLQRVVSK